VETLFRSQIEAESFVGDREQARPRTDCRRYDNRAVAYPPASTAWLRALNQPIFSLPTDLPTINEALESCGFIKQLGQAISVAIL
jgi:hypothetical protein